VRRDARSGFALDLVPADMACIPLQTRQQGWRATSVSRSDLAEASADAALLGRALVGSMRAGYLDLLVALKARREPWNDGAKAVPVPSCAARVIVGY
jgi:hypothetical protein